MNKGYLVIGDIHGCANSLRSLMNKISREILSNRLLVFIGDYIDRGPNSKKVVEILLELEELYSCIFLRGNHEQMLLDALHKGKETLWFTNGGQDTLRSYGVDKANEIDDAHKEFYRNTRLYFETPDFFFVHAGVSPFKTIEQSIEEHQTEEFLWTRSHLNADCSKWEKTVVFGHTPITEVHFQKNKIGIDTGCVYTGRGMGKLTALKLPEKEIIQQNCID